MFSGLDPDKMSSTSQKVHVFPFPGADVHRMMGKIQADAQLQNLAKKGNVLRLFIMTGTCNVDNIMVKGEPALAQTKTKMKDLILLILKMFPRASLFLVNILPRSDSVRMQVIHELNKHLLFLSTSLRGKQNIHHIDTYWSRMFTDAKGFRVSRYFKKVNPNDNDNVHLDIHGTIRLGSYLKYMAHNES